MRVEIQPINQAGRPLPTALRKKGAVYRGKLSILENRLHAYGRSVTCARLVSTTDGVAEDLLPPLQDVHILWLDADRMRLRGTEEVEGAQFGQTWDIKVL